MSNQNPNRVSAGVPTGGQFAASARAESDTALGDPPVPLADAVPAGEMLTIGEHEFDGSYSFDYVDVTRNDDGAFTVRASSRTDVAWGATEALCKQRGIDAESEESEQANNDALDWLNEHDDDFNAWFEDTTGSSIGLASEWDTVEFGWSTTLSADASTDEVLTAADEASGTHPEDMGGFYDRMLREVPGFAARNNS